MKLIFVSMDTLRADHLTGYGYDRPTTPNIDRLAREGALFENAFASDVPTQPSHTAVFTGRFGVNSGIVSHYWPPAALDEKIHWLPSMMQAAGRPTGAVDHLFVMKDWFIRGYDDYIPPPGRSRSPAAVVNELAFPWIAEHARDDFFMFLHYWDAHIPYVPAQPFAKRFAGESRRRRDPLMRYRLRSRPSYPLFKRTHYDFLDEIPNLDHLADLYDAEIAYLDHHIGALRAHLESLGILEDTMLVLFGDHGENMTEHDAWFDHAGLYNSVVHVPLVIRHPATVGPSRVRAMVQLIDVMPTICESLGWSVPDGVNGHSLHPLIRGERSEQHHEVYLSECTWQAKRGLRTTRWKYIRCYDPGIYLERSSPELYDLHADPDEQFNLAPYMPELAETMEQRLSRWLDAQLCGRPDPILQVLETELPAVARLAGVVREEELANRVAGQEVAVADEAPTQHARSA